MNPLDFTNKRVLVVGGSSGIGNGIARAFLNAGADVHVWGTRATAADYAGDDGSDLSGLSYAQMDVSDFAAIEAYTPPFTTLDVLVLSQGIVLYKRQEFEMAGFQKVMDVNLGSLMACAAKFHDMLTATKGSLITISSTAGFHATRGNPPTAPPRPGLLGSPAPWVRRGRATVSGSMVLPPGLSIRSSPRSRLTIPKDLKAHCGISP